MDFQDIFAEYDESLQTALRAVPNQPNYEWAVADAAWNHFKERRPSYEQGERGFFKRCVVLVLDHIRTQNLDRDKVNSEKYAADQFLAMRMRQKRADLVNTGGLIMALVDIIDGRTVEDVEANREVPARSATENLAAATTLICTYCGHEADKDIMKLHVKSCEQNPLVRELAAEREIRRARELELDTGHVDFLAAKSCAEEAEEKLAKMTACIDEANNALFDVQDDAEHQISSHADTLLDEFRRVSKAARTALHALQKTFPSIG